VLNPDSSGNGLRIFARAMLDGGHVRADETFHVDTGSRLVMCRALSAREVGGR
jgi:diaminopimelate epimerase